MKRVLQQRDLLAASFLFLLALLFLWQGTLAGKALLPADDLFAFFPWQPHAQELGVGIPHNDLIADMVLQNYPWKEFIKTSLSHGELPLWNPYILTGMPFLAAGQSGVLYPLGLPFFLLLPTAYAYVWFTALHLFLGGLFTYCYLRTIDTGRWGSLFGGTAFSLMGFLIVSLQWPQMVSAAIWLPWLLMCLEQAFRRAEGGHQEHNAAWQRRWMGTPFWTLAGAVGIGLQFLAGHLEISFYLLFTLLAYSIFRLGLMAHRQGAGWSLAKAAAAALLIVGLGSALAGIQLVPFSELIQQNYRAGQMSFQEVLGAALPKKQLLAFLAPDIFGNPTHHTFFDLVRGVLLPVQGSMDEAGRVRSYPFWGVRDYVEGTAYLGLLPLLLAGGTLLLRRDRYTGFFTSYGLLALLLAFGTPLYALFFFGVPGFDQVHSPFRWLLPYSFCIVILAGRGADALLSGVGQAETGHRNTRWWRRLGAGAALAGLVILALLLVSRLVLPLSLSLTAALLARSVALQHAFPSSEFLYSYQFGNLLRFGLLLMVSGGAITVACRRTGVVGPAALLAVLTADLALFGWSFVSFTPPDLMRYIPPALQWLQQDQEPYRIVTYDSQNLLPPNSAMLAGVQDARGYDSIILRQYVDFWKLLEDPSGLRYNQINRLAQPASLDSPLLDLMNVKYVLTRKPLAQPGFSLAYRGDLFIYQNENVLTRAFPVFDAQSVADQEEARGRLARPDFDPRRTVLIQGRALPLEQSASAPPVQPARVLSYEANRVVVATTMEQAGYLVLTDAFFPGWQAQDQLGQKLPVLRADAIFRAVRLESGEHIVTFSYAPDNFKLGLYVSFLGIAALILTAAYWAWRGLSVEMAATSGLRRVAKNSLTPLAGQVLTRGIDLGFAIVMLRLLGPENYGSYAFAVVLIGYFAILTDFGLGTLLTREVARDPAQGNRYAANSILLRLGLSVAAAPVLLVVALLYHWRFDLSGEAVITALLFMVSLVPSGLAGVFSAVFSAHEKMEYQALVSVGTALLRVSLGLVALLMGWGIIGLGVASVVASTATALAYYLLVSHLFFRPRLEADWPFARGLLTTSAPLMLNNLLNTVFFRADMLLLQPMRGVQAVGYYATAYKFVDALLMIPSFIILALFPVMARYAQSSPELLLHAYTRTCKGLLLVALPISVGVTIIAEQLIALLFGESFAPAAHALQILIWFLPFSYVNGVTQYLLIAANQQRTITVAFLIATSFNLVANLVAIPVYGIAGAAVVTVLSELVLMVPFARAVYRYIGPIPLEKLGLRAIVAATLLGLLLWPMRHLSLFLLVPVGVVIYVLALLALRVFDEEDRRILRSLRAR